ncbi:hypothetical protein BKH41_03280 [Helicobacter sp. 12S02232-10]|uniref:TetR/AcrR family transcriptional regulator n=1 Tax=Helicobacter sp. 12S02232-10 TaxID=1476197 RepID=UPI000BA55E8A|nr:TetR/AcrR family transcriptional regulator [Helicobacter sp. 12S02232-10]PAF49123.1 hypothetical protein BKH41_03280 [Helicobacter sp. 12S02232-10]
MQDKRQEIILNATKIIFKTKISNFSLNAFLNEIKIPKGVFYYYFKSKDELIFEILSSLSETYRIRLENQLYSSKTLREKLMHIFDIYCFTKKRNFEICEFYADFFSYTLNTQNKLFKQHIKKIKEDTKYLITQSFHTDIASKKRLENALAMSEFLSFGIDSFFLCYEILSDGKRDMRKHWKIKNREILIFIEAICDLLEKNTERN